MSREHNHDGYDEDRTPRDLVIPFAGGASNHPRVKVARTRHITFVTVTAELVIGGLAALQHWPAELTLGALGVATGLWAVGAYRKR